MVQLLLVQLILGLVQLILGLVATPSEPSIAIVKALSVFFAVGGFFMMVSLFWLAIFSCVPFAKEVAVASSD